MRRLLQSRRTRRGKRHSCCMLFFCIILYHHRLSYKINNFFAHTDTGLFDAILQYGTLLRLTWMRWASLGWVLQNNQCILIAELRTDSEHAAFCMMICVDFLVMWLRCSQRDVKGSLQYLIMAALNHCTTGVVGDEAFQYPHLNFKYWPLHASTAPTHWQGDILLVADEFNDGWMRGLRLGDLEVAAVKFHSKMVH